MKNLSPCEWTAQWLRVDALTATPSPITPTLCAHIAACPSCRTALFLLASDLLQIAVPETPLPCDQCMDDLPAYIDLERDEGIQVAATTYPHIWWHLWTCADCAETYQMTLAIQAAEATGALTPIPLASLIQPLPAHPLTRLIRSVKLPRPVIFRALVPIAGAQLSGGTPSDALIHDDEDANYELRTTVQKRHGAWHVLVQIDPPISGDAVIQFGSDTFRAAFDHAGAAQIGPIPAELLLAADGPDLDLRIETHVG